MLKQKVINIFNKQGFIDYSKILQDDIALYWLHGQRRDGKTFGALKEVIKAFAKHGYQSAYIRRYDDYLVATQVKSLFNAELCAELDKRTNGKYNHVIYKGREWYACKVENDEIVYTHTTPIMYARSINTWEGSKGADRGFCAYTIFDEVVSNRGYLKDEYMQYCNVLDSIIRHRTGTKIILLSNPISKICPYYDEFGIHIEKLEIGTEYIYEYPTESGVNKLKFVYLPPQPKKIRAKTNYYQIGRRLESINTGYWDINNYRHLQSGVYKESEKHLQIGVEYKRRCFVIEINEYNGNEYIFYRPSNEIEYGKYDIVISDKCVMENNVYMAVPVNNVIIKYYHSLMQTKSEYYATNECGDMVENWKKEIYMKRGSII